MSTKIRSPESPAAKRYADSSRKTLVETVNNANSYIKDSNQHDVRQGTLVSSQKQRSLMQHHNLKKALNIRSVRLAHVARKW